MRKKLAASLLLFGLMIALTTGTVRAADTFTAIDYPGAANTLVRRMNPRGDLVGNYRDAAGMHGFLMLR